MRKPNATLKKLQKQIKQSAKQAEVIDFMEDIMYTYSPDDPEGTKIVLDPIYSSCAKATGVSKPTVRRWWRSYIMLGELPYETKDREKSLQRDLTGFQRKPKSTMMILRL